MALKLAGASFNSLRIDTFLTGKTDPSSINANFPELYAVPTTAYLSSDSVTLTTLHVVVCRVVFCKIQILFAFGAVVKLVAVVPSDLVTESTVITAPFIEDTVPFSTEPSDKITLSVGLLVASKSVFAVSSTVIVVVVADLIIPPRLTPALTGSLTSIT